MRGWIFFPEKQNSSLQDKLQLILGMSSFADPDDELEDASMLQPGRIQGASLGFYCGPLAGENSSAYPSLLEGVSKYPRTPYKPRFQPTQKIWETLPDILVRPSGETPAYLWTEHAFTTLHIVVNGSFPKVMEDMFVRGCRTFLFSQYIMK